MSRGKLIYLFDVIFFFNMFLCRSLVVLERSRGVFCGCGDVSHSCGGYYLQDTEKVCINMLGTDHRHVIKVDFDQRI